MEDSTMSDEVKLNDQELDGVQGGYGPWQQYAKGRYDNYGSYITIGFVF